MGKLILIRHGRSEWNDKGLWTGLTDISLNETGREEARKTAEAIKDLQIDLAYTSDLKRAYETLDIILNNLNLTEIPVINNPAINERDYGIYTGRNKWEVKKGIGEEEFMKIRRSWDCPIPEGESLKKVYERVLPYYEKEIFPKLKEGKNVLIVAHGNSLRALAKSLENISDQEISKFEIRTGEALIYCISKDGEVESKETRAKNKEEV